MNKSACSSALRGSAERRARVRPQGYVVEILSGRLVLIDLGAADKVAKGDYFDIVSSEVLTHPLTGDTLAVSPKSVGALQIVQVLDKMSVARLLELTPGENVMWMPIVRVQHAERLEEIQRFSSLSATNALTVVR